MTTHQNKADIYGYKMEYIFSILDIFSILE
jgi:hypothetical protein